jgi:hypothetical protein
MITTDKTRLEQKKRNLQERLQFIHDQRRRLDTWEERTTRALCACVRQLREAATGGETR